MKKTTKILVCVLAVLVIAGSALAVWQRNNLNALRYSLTLKEDELRQQLDENKQVLDDAMEQFDIPQYDISREVLDQMDAKAMTAEDVAKQLLASQESTKKELPQPALTEPSVRPPVEEQAAVPTQTEKNVQSEVPTEAVKDAEADAQTQIQELIAAMYVLRGTYIDKLDQVVQSAIEEYTQGSMTEQRRTEVVYARFEQLQAMEAECDEQVALVVSRLRELLKQTGQDDTLAKQVEQTYENEKSLKKAAYIRDFLGE